MASFVWSPASAETSREPRLTKACFFLCTGSLLAAHRQYPLIKPVTPSLTVTLKNQTKVTLCSKSKRSTSTLFICFPLNRRPFSLTCSSFYLSGGKLQPNESNWKLPLSVCSGKTGLKVVVQGQKHLQAEPALPMKRIEGFYCQGVQEKIVPLSSLQIFLFMLPVLKLLYKPDSFLRLLYSSLQTQY